MLRENPDGLRAEPLKFEKFRSQGFSTPSGKVELFSERLEKAGHPPVPFQGGSLEGAIAFADTVADGALIGMSGERTNRFTHTQFHNIPSLLKREGEGYADLHPEDARRRNITDGQTIEITTPRGRVRMKSQNLGCRASRLDQAWLGLGGGRSGMQREQSDRRRSP